MNRPAEILLRAAELVQKGWVQRTLAADHAGGQVSPYNGRAIGFCAVGALKRAAAELDGGEIRLGTRTRLLPNLTWVTESEQSPELSKAMAALLQASGWAGYHRLPSGDIMNWNDRLPAKEGRIIVTRAMQLAARQLLAASATPVPLAEAQKQVKEYVA